MLSIYRILVSHLGNRNNVVPWPLKYFRSMIALQWDQIKHCYSYCILNVADLIWNFIIFITEVILLWKTPLPCSPISERRYKWTSVTLHTTSVTLHTTYWLRFMVSHVPCAMTSRNKYTSGKRNQKLHSKWQQKLAC